MAIKHLEDLKTFEFLNYLKTIENFSVTEKIDGSELVVGFDGNSKFYTSRELKGGTKYYKDSDWPKLFWTTGFRGAHIALENIKDILLTHIGLDNAVEIEVLYGLQPNTLQYNNNINQIVFLRTLNKSVDFKQLQNDINYFTPKQYIEIEIPVPETGYLDYKFVKDVQQWQTKTLPVFQAKKLDKKILNVITKLRKFLVVNDYEYTKINKSNKEHITKIRNQIQEYKNEIKKLLVKKYLNQTSNFGNCKIEGLVFSNNHHVFKLVDKDNFTAQNKSNHAYKDYLQDTYWTKFKKDLLTYFNVTVNKKDIKTFNDIEKLTIISKNFNKSKEHIIKQILKNIENLSNEYNKSSLIEIEKVNIVFASLKMRLDLMLKELSIATCNEHLIEIILFEKISLIHLKNYKNSVRPILISEIPATFQRLYSMLNNEDIELAILGSSKFANTSNDLDIAIDINVIDKEKIIQILKDNNVEHTLSAGLNIIHTKFPIANYQGYVQLDLMLSENLEWTKFWFTGSTKDSNYKGLYRNALISAIVASTNFTISTMDKDLNAEIYYRKGWVLVPNKGLQQQTKERLIGKTGKRNKTFSITEKAEPVTNINILIVVLFMNILVQPHDIDNFEKTWQLVLKFKTKDEIKLIVKIFDIILSKKKRPLPIEAIAYK